MMLISVFMIWKIRLLYIGICLSLFFDFLSETPEGRFLQSIPSHPLHKLFLNFLPKNLYFSFSFFIFAKIKNMDIIYKPFSRESEINPISLPTANPTLPKNTFQSTPPEGYKREFLEPAAQPTEKPTSQIKPLPDNIFRMKIVSAKTTSLETPTQNRIQGFLDQLEKHNIKVNVTSRNRPGAKTKQGRTSFHATNDAVDITPVGQTFEQLREQIGQIPELLKYMRDNSLGILDETTPEMLAKTGGTGAH